MFLRKKTLKKSFSDFNILITRKMSTGDKPTQRKSVDAVSSPKLFRCSSFHSNVETPETGSSIKKKLSKKKSFSRKVAVRPPVDEDFNDEELVYNFDQLQKSPCSSEQSKKLRHPTNFSLVLEQDTHSWNWNCFEYSNEAKIEFIQTKLQLLNQFYSAPLKSSTLHRCLQAISAGYKDVEFHTFTHGFSVAQHVLFFIFTQFEHWRFSDSDFASLLAFVIASLAHDIGHPGFTRLKHYQHPIEDYHFNKLRDILQDETTNPFLSFSEHTREKTLEDMEAMILDTQMCRHNEHRVALEEMDKEVSFGSLLHVADLSGQCMSLQLALQWEDCFNRETQLFSMEDKKARFKSQVEFIGTFVKPLWIALDQRGLSPQFCARLDRTLVQYRQEIDS